MGYIKKKQILGLKDDLTSLQYGLPILKRDTLFTGVAPLEGQAILDSNSASSVTELKLNVKDDVLGNTISDLEKYKTGDTLIIRDGSTSEISSYEITSINSSTYVNSSNEGYFILTIQHSFGYSGTLSQGALHYYFRRDTSAIVDMVLGEQLRAQTAEYNLQGQILNIPTNPAVLNAKPDKYVEAFTITSNTVKSITHNLNSTEVIVQIIDTNSGSLHTSNVYNYNTNSVDVDVLSPGDYKVIIIG